MTCRRELLLIVCLVLPAANCARTPPPQAPSPPPPAVVEPPPPSPPPPPAATAAPPLPPAVALSEDELFARKTLDELNAERPLGTVYFDYDSSDLREDAGATLTRNAEWMRRWPSTRIVVEGHCDERGTPEYNLALGSRRAQAVRAYLVALGIAEDRVQATSRGEEAPVCSDSTEACWQQNRRGAPTITAK
jgi:peptidoglycan-associated lipoprotein